MFLIDLVVLPIVEPAIYDRFVGQKFIKLAVLVFLLGLIDALLKIIISEVGLSVVEPVSCAHFWECCFIKFRFLHEVPILELMDLVILFMDSGREDWVCRVNLTLKAISLLGLLLWCT